MSLISANQPGEHQSSKEDILRPQKQKELGTNNLAPEIKHTRDQN